MIASDVLGRVRIVLNDVSAVRWPDAELLSWLTDGQRAVAVLRPDASGDNVVQALVAGTKQSLPTDCARLFDIPRNLSAEGAVGRAIRYVDRETLDSIDPNWHTAKASTVIKHYVYDGRDQKNFYVFPPAAVGASVQIFYSRIPPVVSTTSATLLIPDVYLDALVNYVLFRAYTKDAEFGQNAALAQNYLGLFGQLIGTKTKTDVSFSPDLHSKGAQPDTAAIQSGSV